MGLCRTKFLWLAGSCILAAVTLLFQGCANPGPPHPPSLHLPAQAAVLKADRVGGHVDLSWTTPDKTSDGLPLKGPITAALCREFPVSQAAKNPHPAVCTPFARIPVSPGESRAVDTLPPALATGSPQLVAYRVELLNTRGRSANPSPPAFAPSGAAPEPPGPLRLSATRRGVLVQWQPADQPKFGLATVELSRVLVANATGQATGPVTGSASVPATGQVPRSQHRDAASSTFQPKQPKNPTAPVLLKAKAQNDSSADPGGLLDPGALPQNTYTYTAQRVRTVILEGHVLELRSAISPAATFTFRDVFPPAAPSGLESIAAAPSTGQPSIDLSWEPSLEPDLLGYNVYRADAPSGAFHRLNPEPLSGPAFRDLTALPGLPYRYRVTALDREQNEGPPSSEVHDTIVRP